MVPTLFSYWRSSAAYRVRIALALKGLSYETVGIDLIAGAQHDEGYVARNPQGLVPFLVDGEQGFAQSLAIIEYLDEAYPEPPLLPNDAIGRARVRAAAQLIACDIHPLNNLRVLKHLRRVLDQDQSAIDEWQRHWITEGFTALEAIARTTARPYLFGDRPTIADILLVPQMANARRVSTDLSAFPTLVRIDEALCGLEAFAAARPDDQPDALTK